MSFQAMTWAVTQDTKSTVAKCLLLVLANYADKDYQCWPSQKRLARDCSCGRDTITRAMGVLEDLQLITRQKRYSSAGHRSTDLVTLFPGSLAQENPGKQQKSPAKSPMPDNSTQANPAGDNPSHPKTENTTQDHPVKSMLDNPAKGPPRPANPPRQDFPAQENPTETMSDSAATMSEYPTAEPVTEPISSIHPSFSLPESEKKPSDPEPPDRMEGRMEEISDILGAVAPGRVGGTLALTRWLAAGLDYEVDILPVMRAKAGLKSVTVQTIAAFEGDVMAAHARRLRATGPVPVPMFPEPDPDGIVARFCAEIGPPAYVAWFMEKDRPLMFVEGEQLWIDPVNDWRATQVRDRFARVLDQHFRVWQFDQIDQTGRESVSCETGERRAAGG